MYSGIKKIEEVIEYIENNITSEINCNILANKMNLSVYEFRRIFSFIVGCPISEYIRKRRLSLAACDIMTGRNINMIEISEKYGYSSQSAFIKAFGEHHGFAPTMCLKGNCEVNMFTRPHFQINISGRDNISFRITESEEFYIQGCRALSTITDSCCCDDVWSLFYENGIDKKLLQLEDVQQIFVSYYDQEENVDCTIGMRVNQENDLCDAFNFSKVAKSRFACFKVNTVDDDIVNKLYSKILYEYIPSANLKRREDLPVVEVFPFDMSTEGFEWEIRIPIE